MTISGWNWIWIDNILINFGLLKAIWRSVYNLFMVGTFYIRNSWSLKSILIKGQVLIIDQSLPLNVLPAEPSLIIPEPAHNMHLPGLFPGMWTNSGTVITCCPWRAQIVVENNVTAWTYLWMPYLCTNILYLIGGYQG